MEASKLKALNQVASDPVAYGHVLSNLVSELLLENNHLWRVHNWGCNYMERHLDTEEVECATRNFEKRLDQAHHVSEFYERALNECVAKGTAEFQAIRIRVEERYAEQIRALQEEVRRLGGNPQVGSQSFVVT